MLVPVFVLMLMPFLFLVLVLATDLLLLRLVLKLELQLEQKLRLMPLSVLAPATFPVMVAEALSMALEIWMQHRERLVVELWTQHPVHPCLACCIFVQVLDHSSRNEMIVIIKVYFDKIM
jgi:hypothetical protein